MMKRTVEPEWLDGLPEKDPHAVRSRLDLRRVNFIMGNARIVARELNRIFPGDGPQRILELGAGDGTFALRLAREFSERWRSVELTLVDRQNLADPEISRKFRQLGWSAQFISADVFDFLATCEPVDCIFTNLFLHHFEPGKLSTLLGFVAAKTKAFVACEPRRTPSALAGTKLLGLIGCNAVTRHDATISVRAGFRGREVSGLWPLAVDWKIEEVKRGFFSHTFVAARR
ncbi:MAG: methyltransferase domain-containing protein [Verrucomicrobiota bacterium]